MRTGGGGRALTVQGRGGWRWRVVEGGERRFAST